MKSANPALLLFPCVLLCMTAPAPAVSGEPDFRSPGPFAVGARTVVLVDEGRADEFTGGPRTLVTELWYPADEESRKLPRMRFSEFFGAYRAEGSRALKRDLESIDRDWKSLAARDAAFRPGRWPILIFSHGNGGFRHQNAFQMEHLASHGYVVASPDHTGNSRLSPLPDRAVGYDRRGRARSAKDRPLDARFLIDRLSACDRPALGWLSGGVDPQAVGVLGHSFGGFTAVKVVEEDPRVKAILPMTVAFIGRPASVPTMVMLGAHDGTVGKAGNLASRGYFLGCAGPRYLLVLERGGHFTFTEMGVINPDFGDGIGRGKGSGNEGMEFIPCPLAREIINAYTLAFFERHLRQSEPAARFLLGNHYPREVEWWVGERQLSGPAAAPVEGSSRLKPSNPKEF